MDNPKTIIVNGEVAYRYVDNENYYITKTGILYSTYVKGAHGKTDINRIRPVAYGQDRDGYYRVILSDNGNKKYIKIHQIVVNQFLGGCPNDMVINHKDGNKHNNDINNLEIITNIENIQHAWETGLTDKNNNPNRIPVDIFDNQTGKIYHFTSLRNAADAFDDISITYVRNIMNGYHGFHMHLSKKIITGTRQTDYYIECYYNGKLYMTFNNVTDAANYFDKKYGNTVSSAFKAKYAQKVNRYTITFPNVSTIESAA